MSEPLCNCCSEPANLVANEVDIGPVCEACRVELRFAHSALKRAGFRLCNHETEWRERRRLIPNT